MNTEPMIYEVTDQSPTVTVSPAMNDAIDEPEPEPLYGLFRHEYDYYEWEYLIKASTSAARLANLTKDSPIPLAGTQPIHVTYKRQEVSHYYIKEIKQALDDALSAKDRVKGWEILWEIKQLNNKDSTNHD